MARHREPITGMPPSHSPIFLGWPPFSIALPKAPEGPLRAQRPRENSSIMPDWQMMKAKIA